MEPAQATPLRRRRRWLIVALLVLLVCGVAWWNWPRGDARFVGTWVLADSYEHEFEVIELFSDGTGLAFESTRELELRKPFWQIKWRGDGESFAIKYGRKGLYANIDFVVGELWRALDDRRCVLWDDCFRVLEVDKDAFRIGNNNTVLPWVRMVKHR